MIVNHARGICACVAAILFHGGRGWFLKERGSRIGGEVKHKTLDLSTELITKGKLNTIKRLKTFRKQIQFPSVLVKRY